MKASFGVRVATSSAWFKGDDYYGAFQEFGWKAGRRPKGYRLKGNQTVDFRKQVPGKHFVQQAYESRGETALRTFITLVTDRINKEA